MLHGETVHAQRVLHAGVSGCSPTHSPKNRANGWGTGGFVLGPPERLRHGQQNHDSREDHQVGVEQDEDTGMVETPFAAQAAGRLCHAPRGHQEGEKLPVRAVQIADVREAGQAQAGCKCAQRKQQGAQQRFLPQSKDVGAKAHNLSLYRDGSMGAICRIQAVVTGIEQFCLSELKSA